MASSNAWADYETLRHNVKLNTVDRLKQILTGFNDECGTNFTKSGKKQELIDRITREMDTWRDHGSVEKWARGKTILSQVRQFGVYSPSRMNAEQPYASASSSHHTYAPPVASSHSYGSSTSAIPRYDPYAPPRRPAAPAASTSAAPPGPSILFKPSPFFRVERAVSSIVECPESTSSMDRRQQSLSFTINNDILSKLNSSSSKYQLRLYCTSSTFHSSAAFRTSTGPCPIEFPPTCEVRVNNTPLTANLKGMKKKPGTAPPPELGKSLRLSSGASNRVEMVYVNSQQPVLSKKYYLVVMLVETTSVDQLIDRLKKGKYKSKEEILGKMIQAASIDDDIVAGHQKMSLKCPLSYMRISTPCRSALCVHSQCFDALSWFSVMEQTTTWLCPVCEKLLNVEDLIVDGYFDEILKSTSEDVEDVIVEADGQWHTEDNKFASAEWKMSHPFIKPSVPATPAPAAPVKQRSPSPAKPSVNSTNGHPRPSNAEIVILDSDDEDEGRVKRELSWSYETGSVSSRGTATQPPRSQTAVSDVIDLTLDSEDEAPPRSTKKRKAVDNDIPSPTEQIWKKSRSDALASPPSSSSAGPSAPYVNDSHYQGSWRAPNGTASAGSTSRYQNAFNTSTDYIRSMHSYLPRLNGTSSPENWR